MALDTRWAQRLENYQNMLAEFDEALQQDSYTSLEMAGIIQLFNLSFDLAWKTIKDYLAYEGHEVNSPRTAIKQAFASGLIADGSRWLELLEKHNELVHAYDKAMAQAAVAIIKERYAPLFEALRQAFEDLS